MKLNKRIQHILITLISIIVMLSCSFPGQNAEPTENVNVMTAAALTVEALTTLTQQAEATATVEGTATPTPTENPTNTPPPTSTFVPTNTQVLCDRAQFVTDVTVPDGTEFNPGDDFTKTWRILNNGSCTWNTSYRVVFDRGDRMAAPESVSLTRSVSPGQTIDISINMEAPATPGEYRGDWKMRNASNQTFGIGVNATGSFFVVIKVVSPSGPSVIYNFAQRYCDAEWRSGAGVLPCPGGTSDSAGFIVRNDNPRLSDGISYTGIAIQTHPEWVDNGVITGLFPQVEVKEGYRIKAKIGCLHGGTACSFRYQITYKADGAALQLLTQDTLTYAAGPKDLDINLSSLVGKNVEFALVATANGPATQDWVMWLNPRIEK